MGETTLEEVFLVPDYPRPQLVRSDWQDLNGTWRYSFDTHEQPERVSWQGDIRVPFPPESPLSGVHDEGFHPVTWYQRNFSLESWQDKRILLHFGAVDYRARVWVNGHLVATHEGGHTPFHADITDVLTDGEQTVTVRAEDDPLDLSQPRGKQEWQEKPHGIWYPRTSGIWQPVWLEPVSPLHISGLRMTPNLGEFSFGCRFEVSQPAEGLSLSVQFSREGTVLANDTYKLDLSQVRAHRQAELSTASTSCATSCGRLSTPTLSMSSWS